MPNVSGLSHKNDHEPSLINKDLLKFSSINPPKTKAKINGGIGKSYSLKIVATTAIPIIRKISKLLNDIRYIPVTEKNNIIGIKKVLGTARILAI
jgi:predicted membrane protein